MKKKDKLKIVIVSPSVYVYGGAEVLMIRLLEYLKSEEHEVKFLTTNMIEEYESDLIKLGVEIYKYPFKQKKSTLLNVFKEAYNINKALKEIDYDLINVHNFPANLILHKRSPIVWMCNEPTEVVLSTYLKKSNTDYRKLIAKLIIFLDKKIVRRNIDKIIVSDEYNKNRYNCLYGMNSEIINYGIDYTFFSQKVDTVKDEKYFKLVQVGMITELKNQFASLNAIKKLKDQIPNIKLILAGYGEGEYYNNLLNFIEKENLKDNVELLGHVNREKIRELYNYCDIMIHPVYEQGGWLSPFEAISAKIPVIVSKSLTASKIIEENDLGTVVIDSYVDAIEKIYKEKNREKNLDKKAFWVRDNLSWNTFSEKMLNSFYKVIK